MMESWEPAEGEVPDDLQEAPSGHAGTDYEYIEQELTVEVEPASLGNFSSISRSTYGGEIDVEEINEFRKLESSGVARIPLGDSMDSDIEGIRK